MRKHIANFMLLRCAPDILQMKLFPNAKEISESMGAFAAMERTLARQNLLTLDNPNIALVSVGDGATPRTAGLFAFRTKWQCYSIDPHLRAQEWNIARLQVLRRRVEDENLDLRGFEQVVIALVHSHASLDQTLRHIAGKVRHVIAMPCCVPMAIPSRTYVGIDDPDVWSPKTPSRCGWMCSSASDWKRDGRVGGGV